MLAVVKEDERAILGDTKGGVAVVVVAVGDEVGLAPGQAAVDRADRFHTALAAEVAGAAAHRGHGNVVGGQVHDGEEAAVLVGQCLARAGERTNVQAACGCGNCHSCVSYD